VKKCEKFFGGQKCCGKKYGREIINYGIIKLLTRDFSEQRIPQFFCAIICAATGNLSQG